MNFKLNKLPQKLFSFFCVTACSTDLDNISDMCNHLRTEKSIMYLFWRQSDEISVSIFYILLANSPGNPCSLPDPPCDLTVLFKQFQNLVTLFGGFVYHEMS